MNVARNVAANYLGRGFSILSIYLFTPFYIEYLGLAAYGVVSFYTILLALGALVDIGLTATLSREAARTRDPHALLTISVTIERILLAAALAVALGVCLFAEFIARHWLNAAGELGHAELVRAVRMMALAIPAQLGISLCVGGMLGLQKQALGNTVQALFVLVRGGLVIPALAVAPSLDLFLGWQLVSSWLVFGVARTVYLRAMGHRGFELGRASLAMLAPSRQFAAGMFALTAISGINTQLDKAIVSKLFSLEQFGVYSIAAVLSQLPFTAISPLTMAMLPRMTQLFHDGQDTQAFAIYDRFSVLIAILGGIGAFGLVFFAPEVLTVWLGQSGRSVQAVDLVRILAIGTLFLCLSAPPYYLGLAQGHNRTSVLLGLLTAAAFVPVMLAAVSRFGLVGAALPWVMVNLASLVTLRWRLHRLYYRGAGGTGRIILAVLACCAAVLGAARLTADALAPSPLVACAIAGGFVAVTFAAGALVARRRLGLWIRSL